MKPEQVIAQSLPLPNGSILKNRLVKSAMSEALGTTDNRMTERLLTLYRAWAQGGTGLLITGNVMVDRRHLGEPNNFALEDERDLPMMQQWAREGTAQGTQLWMQLNHPGKQSPVQVNKQPVAPSAIPLDPRLKAFFNAPRALADAEIEDIVERFATSARIARKAGFNGVQIHAAHGYLVNQFLSPLHNQRKDRWGGSLENRARFILEILRAARAHTSPDFSIAIKLNSADFQRGGFSEDESMAVAEMLVDAGIDLLEISGGTYEAPEMAGLNVKESTQKREAYFLEYAEKIRERVKVPLMVTGGFRSLQGMADAISSNATDLIGMARPLAVYPELSNELLSGNLPHVDIKRRMTGIRMIDDLGMMETGWYSQQLQRLGAGKNTRPQEHALLSFIRYMTCTAVRGFKTYRLRAN